MNWFVWIVGFVMVLIGCSILNLAIGTLPMFGVAMVAIGYTLIHEAYGD